MATDQSSTQKQTVSVSILHQNETR